MAEETTVPPGPGLMIKPTATSNSTNCISSSSSSSSLDVQDAPRSEPSRDETSSGLGMMARLAFDRNVTGPGVDQGAAAKASTTGSSSLERERGAPSTDLTTEGLPAGSMPSKCLHHTLSFL